MEIKDGLVFRLRGPHVNALRVLDGDFKAAVDEINRLRALCLEAADEIERLTQQLTRGPDLPSDSDSDILNQ